MSQKVWNAKQTLTVTSIYLNLQPFTGNRNLHVSENGKPQTNKNETILSYIDNVAYENGGMKERARSTNGEIGPVICQNCET